MLAISILSLVALTGAAPTTTNFQTCIPSGQFDASVDYFPSKITDGPGWTVKYEKAYKVVTNTIANETYVLYQCGSPKPNVAGKAFSVPIKSLAVQDVTSLTFVQMLANTATVKFVDSMDLVVSACIAAANATGQCTSLAAEPAELKADLDSVDLVFGFSASSRSNEAVFSATGAPGAVARSQWLNYVSLWYNQEAQAVPIAKSISENYDCVSKAASGLAKKPVVAWTDYAPPADFNDNTATWSVVSPAYKTAYTTDSGATILANKSFTNNADFIKYISNVDILIDESFLGTETVAGFLKSYQLTETSDLKFIKNKQVYRTDKVQNSLGWTAWFESAVPSTNLVLSDLTSIVQPTLLSNYKRTFFRNIATEPIGQAGSVSVVSAAQCPSITAAYTVESVQCPKVTPSSGAGKLLAGILVLAALV